MTSARRLHALARREAQRLHVPQPILAETARPSLQAGQVVGVLTTPGASIEILPKIEGRGAGAVRYALTRMLAVAWGLPIAASEPAMLATQRDDLLEVLVRLFADRLLVAVRRGLPHRYRRREDDLRFLRGKLDIHRQFTRHAVRSDLLACRFEELSVDTPLNRVLKAAVRRLAITSRSDAKPTQARRTHGALRVRRRQSESTRGARQARPHEHRVPSTPRVGPRAARRRLAEHDDRRQRWLRAVVPNERSVRGVRRANPRARAYPTFRQPAGHGQVCPRRRPATPVRAATRHRRGWRHRHRHEVEATQGRRSHPRGVAGRCVSDAGLWPGV